MITTWNNAVDKAVYDEVRATLRPLRCVICGEEIYEGDDFFLFEEEPYCSEICITEQLITDGLVKPAVRGEEGAIRW